jgi:hypothetical protein
MAENADDADSPDGGRAACVISGTVRDPSDAAVVGARVTLAGPDGKPVATVMANDKGEFRFDKLAAGLYTIGIEHQGFRPASVAADVTTRPRVSLHVTLVIASVNEEVNVTVDSTASQVSTEVAENQNSNTITASALDSIPVFDQDYLSTISRFLDDGSIATSGVTLVVNGLEANGPGVTSSAIQEIKINQNPYSALFSRPGRARIEIVTKGGSEKFHGSVNFMFRDSMFDATNALAVVKAPEQRRYYEGSLTGPLGTGGKTTFLISLERDEQDRQAIVVANTPGGPLNENAPQPMRHLFGSGRVFRDFGKSDQFWIGYSYESRDTSNQGVGGTTLPEAGTRSQFVEHEVNAGYTHIFSPKLINQLRFLVGGMNAPTISNNAAPRIVVADAFTGGGAQGDTHRTEFHFEGNDVVSCTAGKHELKFGIEAPDISRRGLNNSTNTAGTYYFSSIADYAAGLPATFTAQRGQPRVVFVEKILAGFVEDNIRLKSNLSLSLGARYYWQNYFHDIAHDLAPRLGFAYSPGKRGKYVVRGGAGIFYDRSGWSPIADLLQFNGVNLQRFIVENPSYPVLLSQLSSVPASIVQLDPRARIPYILQYSAGLERQVTKKSSLTATYVGSRGIDLWRSRDVNAPLPPDYLARPNPALGQVRQLESEGYQKSNAFEVAFKGKVAKYFSGQAQYTLSKSYNNTAGIGYFPGNSYAASNDWSRSNDDRRHKFDLLGSVKAVKYFDLGLGVSLYSGKPVNVTSGSDDNRDGIANDRPGLLARNTMHGPGYANLDVRLGRDFALRKAKGKEDTPPTLKAALSAFNILNHRNDVTYVGTLSSAFYGQSVAAQPPRRIQLNVEYSF